MKLLYVISDTVILPFQLWKFCLVYISQQFLNDNCYLNHHRTFAWFKITSNPLSFHLHNIRISLTSLIFFVILPYSKYFYFFWTDASIYLSNDISSKFLRWFLWTWHKLDLSGKRNLHWKTFSLKLVYM